MTGALRIQVWKEFRALAPWWAGILFTVVVATAIGARQRNHESATGLYLAALFAHVAGCAALGALSIGQEYSHRTLGMLLASPVSRRHVLALKSIVLGSLMAILLTTSVVTFGAARIFPPFRGSVASQALVLGPALAGFFLAPWLTMLCRGALAGAVFSVAIPLLLVMLFRAFDVTDGVLWPIYVPIFVAISVVSALMTWLTFMRLAVVEGPQAAGATTLFERPMPVEQVITGQRARRGWFLALLGKEIRLQYMTFTLTALYVALWTLTVMARKADPANLYVGPSHFALTSLHGAVVAVLAGAMAVAEERRHLTADWQVLLPVATWKQWVVKVVVAIGVALFLAIAVPMILALIHTSPDDMSFDDEQLWGVGMLAVIGLYVSSIGTTGLRALLTSLPLMAVAALFSAIVLTPLAVQIRHLAWPLAQSVVQPGTFGSATRWMNSIVFVIANGFGAVLLLIGLSNYRSVDLSRGRILRQLGWIGLYAVIATALIAIFNAFFEAAMAVRFRLQ